MPKLVIKSGTPQAQEYILKPGKNYVGRSFANDLKLEDSSVSGSHAVVEVNGNIVTITDLGSTNGTRINNLPATGSPLQSGQVLKLGAMELVFMADATTGPATPVAPPPPPGAAAQIATEFIIREPSHVGVAATTPPPVVASPAPVATAALAAPIPTATGVVFKIPASAPTTPSSAPVAPAPAPAVVSFLSTPPPVAPAPAPIRPTPEHVPAAPPSIGSTAAPPSIGARLATVAAETRAPVAASPVAPPIPVPPPATPAPTPVELIDPPPGLSVCKFHKTTPGQWLCRQCNLLFCSLCVSTRPTPAGPGYFCRSCGTQCIQTKIKPLEKKKEKQLAAYSDGTILIRTVGFGFGAAIAGAALWTGFAALVKFDVPPIFAVLIGVGCGFAVKVASQDRPGGFFSATAIMTTLLGSVLGKMGAIVVMGNFIFDIKALAFALVGLMIGIFLAWKIGGGDF